MAPRKGPPWAWADVRQPPVPPVQLPLEDGESGNTGQKLRSRQVWIAHLQTPLSSHAGEVTVGLRKDPSSSFLLAGEEGSGRSCEQPPVPPVACPWWTVRETRSGRARAPRVSFVRGRRMCLPRLRKTVSVEGTHMYVVRIL